MRLATFALAIIALSGCTTSEQAMHNNPHAVGKAALCRSFVTTNDPHFRQELYTEMLKRSITSQQCAVMVNHQNEALAVGIAVVAIGAAVAICANNNCGGGGGGGYAWDQFQDHYGHLETRCRSRSTGQFAPDNYCAGTPVNDYTWPGQ